MFFCFSFHPPPLTPLPTNGGGGEEEQEGEEEEEEQQEESRFSFSIQVQPRLVPPDVLLALALRVEDALQSCTPLMAFN